MIVRRNHRAETRDSSEFVEIRSSLSSSCQFITAMALQNRNLKEKRENSQLTPAIFIDRCLWWLLIKKCASINHIHHRGQLTVDKALKFQQRIQRLFAVKNVPTKGSKSVELSGRRTSQPLKQKSRALRKRGGVKNEDQLECVNKQLTIETYLWHNTSNRWHFKVGIFSLSPVDCTKRTVEIAAK